MKNLIAIISLILLCPIALLGSSNTNKPYVKDTSGKALTITVPEVYSYTITNKGVVSKSSKIIFKREIVNDPNRSVIKKGNVTTTTVINKDNSITTSTYNKSTKVETIETKDKNGGSRKKVVKKK